jgi:Chaperone of endosialidase/Secretion system C-terminal sorting domain
MKTNFFIIGISMTGICFAQQFTGLNNTTGVISRTGLVGLGIAAPTSQLHVQTTGATQFTVQRAGAGNQDNALNVFFTSNPAVGIAAGGGSTIFQNTNPNSVSDMLFQPSPTTFSMIIKSNANVGIGEINPITKLGVRGENIGLVSTGTFGSTVFNGTDQWLSLGRRQPATTIGFNSYGFRSQWTAYAFDAAVQERATGTVKDAALTWQDGTFNTDICATVLTNPSAFRFVFRNGAVPSAVGSNIEAARFAIKVPTVTGSCGNVAFLGINNNNPLYELDVRGKINASSQVLANAVVLTSDRRFKKDIVSIENGMDIIRQLNPVNYKFKVDEFKDNYDFDNTLQYGFIAQELETIMPSSVVEMQDGYKGVNYTMLIPVLTNAIKTMDANMKTMQTKYNDLESAFTNLQNENSGMKKVNSNTKENSNISNSSIKLLQNMPNPFGTSTTIQYDLGVVLKNIKLVVSDLNGKTIQVFKNLEGAGKVEISADALNNGIYIYSLVNSDNEVILSKQMLVQK